MYTENKIRNVVEITTAGLQEPFGAFYVFLAPKITSAPTTAIMQGAISLSGENVSFPIAINYWNPIVLNSIDISLDNLTNYRIFVGIE